MKLNRILAVFLFAAASAAVLAAQDWPHDSRGVLLAIARAPQSARGRANPFAGDPAAVQAGRKLFLDNCACCHGADARGRGKSANLHMSDVQNATPGELEWFLENGNLTRRMPSWSFLSPGRRWQLVAYIKSFRKS